MLLALLILISLHFSLRLLQDPRLLSHPSAENDAAPLLQKTTTIALSTLASHIHSQKYQSCWRQCPHRNNHIVVNYGPGAGANDRFYIMNQLGNLAGYLCATLHVPSPSSFLSPHHNRGAKVSPAMRWSDLQNWTWTMPERRGQPLTYELLKLNKTSLVELTQQGIVQDLHRVEGLYKPPCCRRSCRRGSG